MHATVQPDGRSLKPMSGPTSMSQLKSGSDNVQNTGSSVPSQVKGKKRERGHQGFEPIKRERSSKLDADFASFTAERILKAEIVKITERGGLVDMEGVEKLVQLMLHEKSDRKTDLACRSLLASVIAASDNIDCLCRFVQLKGLPVLDEWLQEVHKGKIGDGSGPKDNDKSVDEFLLVMLHALDKLPVNLNALQTCNIGKSVNYFRTHKNLEIQRKVRTLIDTWKKRVEAEMNSHDAKSGSIQPVPWTARQRHAELSHGGNRHAGGGSSEAAIKSSLTNFSASRGASLKPAQAEAMKSAAGSGGTNSKDGPPRLAAVRGPSDPPQTTGREEKSSSSGQSLNNSQSCSSDQAKTLGFQGKEDARSSTAGSMSVNKLASGTSRHRISGVQRESGSSRSSFHRNSASEKMSSSGLTCEKISNIPVAEGINHKLMVKIPNRGRSPAQSVGAEALEDPSVMNSQASLPVTSEKLRPLDRNLKEKSDSSRANITSDVKSESWQSNDFKDVLTCSDEGDGSPAAIPDEEQLRTADDAKMPELPKAASSSSGSEPNSGKLHETSSMSALIENCVKHSEANASVSVGDDGGMNLLASVAAEEISKSDLINSPLVVASFNANDVKPKGSDTADVAQGETQPTSGDGKTTFLLVESSGDYNEYKTAGPCLETNCKPDDVIVSASVAVSATCSMKKCADADKGQLGNETKAVLTGVNGDRTPDSKLKLNCSEEAVNSSLQGEKEVVKGLSSSLKIEGDVKKNVNEGLISGVRGEQKPPMESPQNANEEVPLNSISGKDSSSAKLDEHKAENSDEMRSGSHVHQVEKQKVEQENNASPACRNPVVGCLGSAVAVNKGECVEENIEIKEALEHQSDGLASQTGQHVKFGESKLTGTEVEEADECASTTADVSSVSSAGGSEMDTKMDFDLNEGFNVDDGKYAEPINVVPLGCSAPNLISPLPFPVSSVSNGVPSSITVAAAAKGSFLPPEDLLRSKGELGWKGSAATSAFRPAEPRKVLEVSLGATGALLSGTATGKGRPLLDIDLNVPDERIFEDMACRSYAEETCSIAGTSNYHDPLRISAPACSSGGLDFDLNRVDEATDIGQCSTSNGHRLHVSLLSVKPSASSSYPNGEVSFRGNLDLNNGPGLDETNVEPSPFSQHARSSMPTQTPLAYIRMNGAEMGNFSSWFPPGNTYSAVTIPSILPERGEQSFPIVATGGPPRILGSHIGGNPLGPDAYRGQVLSSSPAAGSFPLTPVQYPVFPFGTSIPMPSAASSANSTYMDSSSTGRLCYPAIHTQFLGPAGSASSQFPRPYIVSLPDGVNGVTESGRKWGAQGLDLNAGPGGSDMEVRDETLRLTSRQLSIAGSQTLADEHPRMYQVAGGVFKRKGPEGGWDTERFSYKQPSWQ